MANKILHLDISKDPKSTELSILPIIYGRVGDEDTQTVTIYTSKRDEEFNLSGWETTFEGTLANGKVKVFDTGGVAVKEAAKGIFEYTFPNRAFSVAGKYERAYFSFVKGNKRATTEDFQIIVLKNADITAEEAETVITEYNKLVKELQELQKENIAYLKKQQDAYMKALEQRLAELKVRISTLETDIKKYEESVQKTATDAKNTISNALKEAVETITKALEAFQNQNFYTKQESDTRFAKKTDLTKETVQLGNVDNYATADQTDAEQGIALNKFATPKGVKQHVDSRVATQEETNAGVTTDKIVNPKTLNEWGNEQLIKRGKQIVLGENRQVADPASVNFGKFGISDNYRAGTFKDDQPYFTVNSDGEVVVAKAGQYLISGVCKRQFRTNVTLWHYVTLVHKDVTSGSETKLDMFPFGGAIQNRNRQSGQQIRQCEVGDKFWCVSESNNTTNACQFLNLDFFTMERLGD